MYFPNSHNEFVHITKAFMEQIKFVMWGPTVYQAARDSNKDSNMKFI
jgi:hypothetical protein